MKNKQPKLAELHSKEYILGENTPFMISEAYKTARTNLIFALAPCSSKITIVTSCNVGEGKSTTCLNMAITMAQMASSVLVIDADMRKPVLHSRLEIPNNVGLSTILGGINDDVAKVITPKVYPNLDILTSGPVPPNPAELLSSKKMEQLLMLVGKHYDYVFIDTPPINVVTDALLMNNSVAGLIFVIRENSTSHPEIQEAMGRVSMTNGKLLGFIKTGCTAGSKHGGYNSKYKYSYKYEYKESTPKNDSARTQESGVR